MKSWVPDSEGIGCSICHCEFSITRRRHHCRKCGVLVCGACSDHFVKLPSGDQSTEVRVCDNCEIKLKEASVVSERMDVNEQITESLKSALKEKAAEIEQFSSFLLHVVGHGDQETMLRESQVVIGKICQELAEVSEKYNELKMNSVDLERDIRAVAQRCLRAEQQTRDGLVIAREIEEYSRQIGIESKLADQLTERIDRIRSGRTPSPERRLSPRAAVVNLGEERSSTATVCDVVKSLCHISY